MNSFRISIQDWHPATLNELLKNRWEAAKLKKRDKGYIVAHSLKVPKATCKRQVILTIFLGHKQRGADPDAYWKSLCDALVHARLLVDDSAKWCELSSVRYDRHPDRQKETVIELIDIETPKRVGW